MILFILNLCLALGWAFLWGDFSLLTIAAGFVAGYLALLASRPLYGPSRYFGGVWRALALATYFLWDLLWSSLRVAWDVLIPRHLSRPGIVGVPLDARTDGEILLTANLISLTPGTLSLDISADRRILWVHAMFIDDPETLRRGLKDGMERRVLEVLR